MRGLRVCRGHGIGFRLVDAVVYAARGRFRSQRLRIENPEPARSYERLGVRAISERARLHRRSVAGLGRLTRKRGKPATSSDKPIYVALASCLRVAYLIGD